MKKAFDNYIKAIIMVIFLLASTIVEDHYVVIRFATFTYIRANTPQLDLWCSCGFVNGARAFFFDRVHN